MLNVINFSENQRMDPPPVMHGPNDGRSGARETYTVQLQHFLDFQYMSNCVEVTLPDGRRAMLIASSDGQAYIRLPVAD